MAWRLALLSVGLSGIILGSWADTPRGIDLTKLRHFPLEKVRAADIEHEETFTFDGITATDLRETNEVRLSGRGTTGRAWVVYLRYISHIWKGDLDGNGQTDFVLYSNGPLMNGSRTPVFSISILLMDQERMPVPFLAYMYDPPEAAGVPNLVDLDNDGRAELAVSTYDENPSDPKVGPLCSGHWVTQLYRFEGMAVREFRGRLGGMSFPLIHNWTYRETECADSGQPETQIQPAELSDGSTDRTFATTTLSKWPDDGAQEFDIVPVNGCREIWPRVVVRDQKTERTITFMILYNDRMASLARSLWERGSRLDLRGVSPGVFSERCNVNLVWAR